MKIFFLFLAFGCLCEAAYVQGCVNSISAAASVTCALTSVTSGNLLIMSSKTQATTSTLATLAVSSSSGVACSWAKVGAATNGTTGAAGSFANTQIAYCVIPSTGAETVQATWTGSDASFTDINVAEYSNSTGWNSSALDVSLSTAKSPASTTCAVGPTATTTNANDLVIGICVTWNASQTWGAVTGYTNRAASSRNTTGFYDKSVTATGTQSFSATIASDIDIAMIATFKQSGAAAGLRVLPNRVSF